MKRSVPLLVALAVGCATGVALREVIVVPPARAQGQVGPNYEYMAVEAIGNVAKDQQLLTSFGQQGWRLVAVTQLGEYPRRNLYFERQLAR
jgi:hypothetical protein